MKRNLFIALLLAFVSISCSGQIDKTSFYGLHFGKKYSPETINKKLRQYGKLSDIEKSKETSIEFSDFLYLDRVWDGFSITLSEKQELVDVAMEKEFSSVNKGKEFYYNLRNELDIQYKHCPIRNTDSSDDTTFGPSHKESIKYDDSHNPRKGYRADLQYSYLGNSFYFRTFQ